MAVTHEHIQLANNDGEDWVEVDRFNTFADDNDIFLEVRDAGGRKSVVTVLKPAEAKALAKALKKAAR